MTEKKETKKTTRKASPKKPTLEQDVQTLKDIAERIPKDALHRNAMKHCSLAANCLLSAIVAK